MPKRRVSVEGLRSSLTEHALNVVVYEEQEIDGRLQEVPIGEKTVILPMGVSAADAVPNIRKAEEDIVRLADGAKALREEINALLTASPPGVAP